MTQYAFNEETFKNALANARKREVEELSRIASGGLPDILLGLKAKPKPVYATPYPMV